MILFRAFGHLKCEMVLGSGARCSLYVKPAAFLVSHSAAGFGFRGSSGLFGEAFGGDDVDEFLGRPSISMTSESTRPVKSMYMIRAGMAIPRPAAVVSSVRPMPLARDSDLSMAELWDIRLKESRPCHKTTTAIMSDFGISALSAGGWLSDFGFRLEFRVFRFGFCHSRDRWTAPLFRTLLF